MQTLDLPELVEHVAEVLKGVEGAPSASIEWERTQESAVVRYLHLILMRIEQIDETRIMPLLRQHAVLDGVITHLAEHHAALKPEGQLAAASFLALAIDTEEYDTRPSAYISPESKKVRRAPVTSASHQCLPRSLPPPTSPTSKLQTPAPHPPAARYVQAPLPQRARR